MLRVDLKFYLLESIYRVCWNLMALFPPAASRRKYFCTQGDITTLAGVYTFSFLGVMTLFSVGTILLKFKRPSLPREVTVSYGTTLVGLTCVSNFVSHFIWLF